MKKFIIVCFVLIAIMSLGAVSAAPTDTTTTHEQVVGVNEDVHTGTSDITNTEDITNINDAKHKTKYTSVSHNDTSNNNIEDENEDTSASTVEDTDDNIISNNNKGKTKLGANANNDKLATGSATPTYSIDVTPNTLSGSTYVAQYGDIIIVNGTFGDATGNVTITFGYSNNYQTFNCELVDGKFTQEITQYNIRNNQQIKVEYNGDDTYKKVTWTKNIHVKFEDFIEGNTKYGQNGYITVNLRNATGNVTFTLNGKTYNGVLENGVFTQEFRNYTLGRNSVSFTYKGDGQFEPISKDFKFNVDANIDAPTIYDCQPAIITVYLGEATGTVNFTFGNTVYSKDIVNGVATQEIENYEIGNNTIGIYYSGDDLFAPFSTNKTFEVLDKENATIISSLYQTNNKNLIFIAIPNGNGTINVTINGNQETWDLIDGVAQRDNTYGDITELIVSYGGNYRLNPSTSNYFLRLNNIITNETYTHYFNQQDGGRLFDFIDDGTTLDFQGAITNPENKTIQISITKPVNIISTTQDAYIDLNTTAGSLLGESPGNSFAVLRGGSGSNITDIYLHNTQLWISNTTNVVLDNISVVVEDQRVGSGVGATTIRDNSSYVTLKNSYLYTRNNGGSSTFTISWAEYCTLDNNTIRAEGNVGNLVYLNVYNIAGAPSGVPLNNYNNITNNKIYGKEGSAISVGLMVEGTYNLIENNTLYKSSISTSFGGVGPHDNIYVGNTMTEGSGLTAQANSTIYGNNVTGALSIGANSTAYNNIVGKALTVAADGEAYNNTAVTLTVSGARAKAYNNTADTLTVSGADAEVYNTTATTLTVSGARAKVHENDISGTTTITSANTQITNNRLNGDITLNSGAKNTTIDNNEIYNTINVNSAATGNHITNNNISTTTDYAIDLGNSGNNNLSGNTIHTSVATGENAIISNAETNIIEDNYPLNANLTINADSVFSGNPVIVTVTVGENVEGNVKVVCDGKLYPIIMNGRTGTIELTNLAPGEHVLTAVYLGNAVYGYSEKSVQINVYRYVTSIEITNNTEPAIGENFEINFEVINENSTSVSTNPGQLLVLINGEPVYVTLHESSNRIIGSYTIENLVAGNYNIVAILDDFDGSIALKGSMAYKTFSLDKVTPVVTIATDELKLGENANVTVTITGATGNVAIIVDGEEHIAPLENGIAKYTIEQLTAGTHSIVANYAGDAKNNPASAPVYTFSLDKVTPVVDIAIDELKLGENANVTVTITGATGNVAIIVDGEEHIAPLENGIAKYTIEQLTAGTHSIVANYAGDAKNNPASTSTSKTLTVLGTEISDLDVDGDLNINGVLKDSNGNGIEDATILYKIGNQNATVNTGANGTFTIKGEENSKVELFYLGSDILLPTNTTITLNDIATTRVKSSINASGTTIYAVDTVAGEKGAYYKVVLKDASGKAIINAPIQINLNGVKYNAKTDGNGVATIQVNINNANTYDCFVSYLGDKKHEASFATTKIVVNKKTTKIVANKKTFKAKAKTKKYTVTLETIKGSSSNGKIYLKEGKKVTLKIKGKTYTAKINKQGKATFRIKLNKKGKYTASIKFAGDNTYSATTKKVKIVIK